MLYSTAQGLYGVRVSCFIRRFRSHLVSEVTSINALSYVATGVCYLTGQLELHFFQRYFLDFRERSSLNFLPVVFMIADYT